MLCGCTSKVRGEYIKWLSCSFGKSGNTGAVVSGINTQLNTYLHTTNSTFWGNKPKTLKKIVCHDYFTYFVSRAKCSIKCNHQNIVGYDKDNENITKMYYILHDYYCIVITTNIQCFSFSLFQRDFHSGSDNMDATEEQEK